MQIQFLGTSSGVPTKRRSLSAIALRAAGARQWSLVDCGEGTQHRLLHARFSLATLESIYITHRHGDHCLGLPGLLASASMDGRSAPLRLVAPEEVLRFATEALALTDSTLSFGLELIDVACPAPLRPAPGLSVAAVPLSHRVPSFAYVFTESEPGRRLDTARLESAGVPRGPHWGQLLRSDTVRLEDGRILRGEDFLVPARAPRKIVIGGDNDTPELLAEACREAQLLVHEATYTAEVAARIGPAPMHSCARRVASFAAAAGLPNLILTHFSPRYADGGKGLTVRDLAREAGEHYKGRLHLARDLDLFELDPEGGLELAGAA